MLQAVATPASLAEAHSALAEHDTFLMAGGTVVMPIHNYGTDTFTRIVSLRRAGLGGIAFKKGQVEIGATTTLAELEEDPALAFLHAALHAIGSPTLRNMATVGGNLFVKPPYGDFAACLVALGATVEISGLKGIRVEPAEETVRNRVARGEIVTRVSFPLPPPGSFRFIKAARRALNSAAIVTVAAVVETADGKVATCRIALGGVANTVVRATSVEAALMDKPLDRASAEEAAEYAAKDIAPFDDAYSSAWYRRRVTPVFIRRALIGE